MCVHVCVIVGGGVCVCVHLCVHVHVRVHVGAFVCVYTCICAHAIEYVPRSPSLTLLNLSS